MRKTNKKKATCHPDKPHAARGLCANCYAKWLRTNSSNYVTQQSRNTKNWFAAHPDYQREHKRQEIRRKGGSAYQRKLDLKKHYGMTTEQYDVLLDAQNGVCAICGKTPNGKRKHLSVDHCHQSKSVRGLLCLSCNCGLGYFKDSVKLLRNALAYLEHIPNPKEHPMRVVLATLPHDVAAAVIVNGKTIYHEDDDKDFHQQFAACEVAERLAGVLGVEVTLIELTWDTINQEEWNFDEVEAAANAQTDQLRSPGA